MSGILPLAQSILDVNKKSPSFSFKPTGTGCLREKLTLLLHSDVTKVFTLHVNTPCNKVLFQVFF